MTDEDVVDAMKDSYSEGRMLQYTIDVYHVVVSREQHSCRTFQY